MSISIFSILTLLTLVACNTTTTDTTTGTPTAPAGLTDLEVTVTTADSVGLTWSQPADFGTTDGTTAARFGSYAVKVYQGADDSGREVEEGLTLTPAPLDESTVSVRVSGLSSGTQYAFKLVLNSDNDSPLSSDSNVVSATTTEEGVPTAPASPRDLAVTEASTTVDTVELTWSQPASFGTTDGTTDAIFGSYAIKVYQGADEGGSEVEGLTLEPSSLDESTVSVKVSGLDSLTQYAFKLVLRNSNDPPLSSDSNIVSVTTQDPSGRIWTKVPVKDDWFPERSDHAAVIFKNKLWIIGGYIIVKGILFNDVWSSPDGKSWTEVPKDVKTPRFSERYSHAAVVFDGKIWVIGGKDGSNNNQNDVWSSPDGKSWTEVTKGVTTSRFSERSAHAVAVFDNKIWVIGGKDGSNNNNNDVWSSPDGKKWTEIPKDATTTRFPIRSKHAAAVFDNKLWVIGGIGGKRFNDIWSSSDGKSWTEATQDADAARFSERSAHAVAVFDNKLWIIGGFDINGAPTNSIWSSPDGKSWTKVPKDVKTSPRFSARNSHAVAVLDNKLWVIGGYSRGPKIHNDVWYSP